MNQEADEFNDETVKDSLVESGMTAGGARENALMLFRKPLTERHESSSSKLAYLIDVGYKLIATWDGDAPVQYRDWIVAFKRAIGEPSTSFTDEQLEWAWNAIRKSPGIASEFGKLGPTYLDGNRRRKRVRVFEAGSQFVVAVNTSYVHLLREKTLLDDADTVVITLRQPLDMRPGKADRLECCDVECEVLIRTHDVHALEREADIMGVEQEQMQIGDSGITVTVKSLNKAYTVASRRQEPQRRAHGGRIYDHLLYVSPGHETRILLEEIRARVESGYWPEPQKASREEQIE